MDKIENFFDLIIAGWLGWIHSWGEAAKSITMGDWTTDNIPNVSISISSQA